VQLPFYRSLRFKIITLFSVVILLGSITGATTSLRMAEQEFHELLHEQFHSTSGIVENFFDLVSQMALIWAGQMSSDPELQAALEKGQDNAFIARLNLLKQQARADSVIWLDHKGRVRYHSVDPERRGNSLMSWRIVRSAVLQQQSDSSVVQDLGNFIIYSTALLRDSDNNFSGTLLVGYAINDELLQQIKKDTAIDITLVRRRAVMASTFSTQTTRMQTVPLSYLEYQLLLSETEKVREMRLGNELYFAEAEPLQRIDQSMEGSILLTYPKQALATIEERLVSRFIQLSLAGFLFVVVLGNSISMRLLNPIRQLIARTNTISEGDMSSRIQLNSRDEVGLLAQHFNRMIEVIEGKNRALQTYSDNLEQIVTERTAELERKKRSLSNAQRIAQMGSWAWNMESDGLEISEEMYHLFGLSIDRDEGTYTRFLRVIHPEDRALVHNARKEALHENRIKPFSFRILRDDNEERIIQAEGEHFDGQQGKHGVIEGTVHDVTERRQEEAAMQQRANYDALTHLPNRNLFADRLQQAWHVAHREHHTLALMFIDLDRFKWVNDNIGHDAGDELLRQVAGRLSACVREADTVARMGGDEFTVILPEVVDRQAIENIAQRMLVGLAMPFTLLGEKEVSISGSIGIALYPQDSEDLDTLLKHADSAMYRAKHDGKNNFQFFQK
jgi:diguanylate cyclase (GGDEF)-like protein/PAS domain S-box-containing protein